MFWKVGLTENFTLVIQQTLKKDLKNINVEKFYRQDLDGLLNWFFTKHLTTDLMPRGERNISKPQRANRL